MTVARVLAMILLLQGLGCSTSPASQTPSTEFPAIRLLRHDIKAMIDPSSHRLRGLDRVTIKTGEREVREVVVTLNKALVVAWVSREDQLLPFDSRPLPASTELDAGRAHQIVVRLDRPARAGETFALDFDYAGEINDPPKEPRHLRFVTPSETSGYIGSEGVYIGPETYWYPDVPD